MRKILLILLFFVAAMGVKAQLTGEMYDSIIYYNDMYTAGEKVVNLYDDNKRLVASTKFLKNAERKWEAQTKEQYQYDNNNRKVQTTESQYNVNRWDVLSRTQYEYDSKGNLVTQITSSYEGKDVWKNREYKRSFYSENKIVADSMYLFDEATNTLRFAFATNYVYEPFFVKVSFYEYRQTSWRLIEYAETGFDEEGKVIAEVMYNIDGEQKKYNQRTSYQYDEQGRDKETLIGTWDGTKWVDSQKVVFDYSSKSGYTVTTYSFDGKKWNGMKFTSYYYKDGVSSDISTVSQENTRVRSAKKYVVDGRIVIVKDGVAYNAEGVQMVK